MRYCNQVTITNVAFDYLKNTRIQNLDMTGCLPDRIAYARSIGLPVVA